MDLSLQKRWRMLIIRGFLFTLFGLSVFLISGIELFSMVEIFGIILIFSGFILLLESTFSTDKGYKILSIAEGIVNFTAGIVILIFPADSVTALMIFISAWAFVSGLFQVATSIKLRKFLENEFFAITGGFVSLIFGIAILLNLIAGAQTFAVVFGLFSIVYGLTLVGLSLRIKKLLIN
jgi:uncharacterized membrane protein HdeD (DUF308 family)